MTMKRIVFAVSFVLLFVLAAASAQDKKKKEAKEVTVTGEVVDIKCYTTDMMGGKGEEHKQCAIDCIKGGLPVGILEAKTEKVYVVVPKAGMKGANEELLPFVAKSVKLTGTFAEKGGQKILIYTKVEEAK
jgi:hypothetical protein